MNLSLNYICVCIFEEIILNLLFLNKHLIQWVILIY